MESDKNILLEILPELVWELVLRFLATRFKLLKSCTEASNYFDTLFQRMGHLLVDVNRYKSLSRSSQERIVCSLKSIELVLFPEPILAKPQITVLNICMTPNFLPINDYLKWLIISQRDSLETLHISCLGIRKYSVALKLPEMGKLRNLQIVRNVIIDKDKNLRFSLEFFEIPLLPALESLTLSAFGANEHWYDFLLTSNESNEPKCPSCPTVQHLRPLPSRPYYIRQTSSYLSNFVFPNLVSLEIPAVQLSVIYWMFPAPKNLKRLTLTLPTRGLHKHLFDVSITGYGEQVCAAILAKPHADILKIRAKIEKENEERLEYFEEWEREVMKSDNEFRRQGIRVCNLTYFTGLEELRLKSDSGNWGPTLVSCRDLLNMKSLKTIIFCGFNPKYIPAKMMMKLRKRFIVITPNSALKIDSTSKIKLQGQNRLQALLRAVWKQMLGRLSSPLLQTVDSYSKTSDVLENLPEKPGVLSISRRDIIWPENFRQWLYSHPEFPPPAPQNLPRITTIKICINSNFQLLSYHLNSLLHSQRDSLETLHISCLGFRRECWEIELPGMTKLRDLQIVRNVRHITKELLEASLIFVQPPVVPVLESLTLSSFGPDPWNDFGTGCHNNLQYLTCLAVKHLRLLPSRPIYLMTTFHWMNMDFVFPNLVSLEVPAILLALICPLLPTPENLKRLTLTLPTRGLHKHLFDACITGYGEQVCATILANPDQNPQEIRTEIGEEDYQKMDSNHDDLDLWEEIRILNDDFYRNQGLRCPNITNILGLEELQIKSDTGDWGPTLVSCADLLNMTSLKTLRFCGHKPKYIPDDMIQRMKQRFTVLWD